MSSKNPNRIHKFYYFAREKYAESAADRICRMLQSFTETIPHRPINIALSGGSTPLPVLSLLCRTSLNWERFRFFQVDERFVPLAHVQSNYGHLKQVFFTQVPSANYPMYLEGESPLACAQLYQQTIDEKLPKVNGVPSFDLILLGMGEDGHTASLFPGTKALNEEENWIVANEVPELDSIRITMSYTLILRAREVCVLINGKNKNQLVESMYESEDTTFPMQKIINDCPKLTWIIEL